MKAINRWVRIRTHSHRIEVDLRKKLSVSVKDQTDIDLHQRAKRHFIKSQPLLTDVSRFNHNCRLPATVSVCTQLQQTRPFKEIQPVGIIGLK